MRRKRHASERITGKGRGADGNHVTGFDYASVLPSTIWRLANEVWAEVNPVLPPEKPSGIPGRGRRTGPVAVSLSRYSTAACDRARRPEPPAA